MFKQGSRTSHAGMESMSDALVAPKECKGTVEGAPVIGQHIARRTQSSTSTAVNHEGLEPSGKVLSLTHLS